MVTANDGEWTLARRRIRKLLATGAIVVVVGSIVAVVAYRQYRFHTIGTLVPCLMTGRYEVGEILLRTTSVDGGELLIAPITGWDVARSELDHTDLKPSGLVYRFFPGIGALAREGLDKWTKATGEVTYRFSKREISLDTLFVDVLTDTVNNNGAALRTAGAYTFDVGESPDRRFVNVLSANARRVQGSVLFFAFAGGWPTGPYYHEVFERVTGRKIGETYTLEYAGQGLPQSYCWEQEAKYVVYHDGEGRALWIVPGPNHKTD